MQEVTQGWIDTNNAAFTNRALVEITIDRADTSTDPVIRGSDLISFSHIKSGDPLSGTITQDKIVFVAKNTNGQLSYDASSEREVYENAMCVVKETFVTDISPYYDTIDGGLYYVSDVKELNHGEQYQFTALTALGFMAEKGNQNIAQMPSGHSPNAYDLARNVIAQAIGSQGVPVTFQTVDDMLVCGQAVQTELSAIGIDYQYGTDNYSLAEILQLVGAMSGCIVYADRKGKIHIEKPPDTYSDYTLPEFTLYKPIDAEFIQRIGNVVIISDHGQTSGGTGYTGAKIGGKQYVTLPILDDYLVLSDLAQSIYSKLVNGRRRFKISCRFDPKLDIFDAITVPYDGKNYSAIITGINATYSGGWKADITAMSFGVQVSAE